MVVSGDEDLLETIESAQTCGTRVRLVEISIGGIGKALVRAVDRRRLVGEAFWQAHLRCSDLPAHRLTGRERGWCREVPRNLAVFRLSELGAPLGRAEVVEAT